MCIRDRRRVHGILIFQKKMSEEEERATKQKYLHQAIMEAGYNAEKFTKYLQSEKAGGADIDNWTLDDLKIACLLYTSPSPRDLSTSRMPSSA
eukprot:TRINITY_DN11652_c0_g1_i1.p3 TRINITY_DN11652_c0_g1~~TRINITY_DN11652_c0_g1_i1.p3  ORF type:complete len:102 (+),score=61.69 TRINITY_DN11652_c0_g1_i1:28-306(+)